MGALGLAGVGFPGCFGKYLVRADRLRSQRVFRKLPDAGRDAGAPSFGNSLVRGDAHAPSEGGQSLRGSFAQILLGEKIQPSINTSRLSDSNGSEK
jgi:hypothetical protein